MSQQVQFIDPKGIVSTYTWPINPAPDDITQPAQKQRQIERTSNTANIGVTRQQGDDGAYIIHWEPHIFHAAHEEAMWQWFELSKLHSIYLVDFNGETYDGEIITLGRQQIGAIAGPGDTNSRKFYAKYIFEFDVWRFINGILPSAGVLA